MIRDEIKEMINFYIEKGICVHLNLSTGKFYNGKVIGWENESVIIFDDRVLGQIHIFVSQIRNLEEYKEVKNGEK